MQAISFNKLGVNKWVAAALAAVLAGSTLLFINRYVCASQDGHVLEVSVLPAVHPVLRIAPIDRQALEEILWNQTKIAQWRGELGKKLEKSLTDDAIRKMLYISVADELQQDWAQAYAPIEIEAAAQICARLKGLSVAQVENLLGPPVARGDSPLCSSASDRAAESAAPWPLAARSLFTTKSDSWLYVFGGRSLLIRPVFVDGICVEAKSLEYELDDLYSAWRVNRLETQSVGKTVQEILVREGPQYPDPDYFREAWCIEDFNSADQLLRYQMGFETHRVLLFKHGRCFRVVRTGSMAATQGLHMGELGTSSALFRRP